MVYLADGMYSTSDLEKILGEFRRVEYEQYKALSAQVRTLLHQINSSQDSEE